MKFIDTTPDGVLARTGQKVQSAKEVATLSDFVCSRRYYYLDSESLSKFLQSCLFFFEKTNLTDEACTALHAEAATEDCWL